MKKIYHLGTCDTCQRIIKELGPLKDFEFQDIKKEPITAKQLDEMGKLSGSYEALFSKRARRYRQQGLHDINLSEEDYRNHILEHYTFLKRPVIIFDTKIFIGNSKKQVEAAKTAIHA